MPTQQTFSTTKIILFVAFISAAIITSLFVFHLAHPLKQTTLSAEEGFIFPAARDIKPFELVSTDHQKFTQNNFYQHWTLLFFGFTHCSSICPTTLAVMNRAYNELIATYPNLQVVLISLDPKRDTPDALATYTKSFNPHFIGASGPMQEIRKLQSQFGIFAAVDNSNRSDNYQLQHSTSLLLINPKGQWAALFNNGMNPTKLANAFAKSATFLSSTNS